MSRYASLQMPDGSRRVAGSTSATHGCKHLCRHCPIVPVYNGTFRAIPLDVVIEDGTLFLLPNPTPKTPRALGASKAFRYQATVPEGDGTDA